MSFNSWDAKHSRMKENIQINRVCITSSCALLLSINHGNVSKRHIIIDINTFIIVLNHNLKDYEQYRRYCITAITAYEPRSDNSQYVDCHTENNNPVLGLMARMQTRTLHFSASNTYMLLWWILASAWQEGSTYHFLGNMSGLGTKL